jgi:hypothetical protein
MRCAAHRSEWVCARVGRGGILVVRGCPYLNECHCVVIQCRLRCDARQFQGRKRVHHADNFTARIPAEWLVNYLRASGFAMTKKPGLENHGLGWGRRDCGPSNQRSGRGAASHMARGQLISAEICPDLDIGPSGERAALLFAIPSPSVGWRGRARDPGLGGWRIGADVMGDTIVQGNKDRPARGAELGG